MTWWVLTYLDNDRGLDSLYVLAATNHPAHLMMAWSTTKPAARPVYRNVRGKSVFCGWKYIWDSPNLTEQNESLDTFPHTFGPIALDPTDHVWYVLSSTTKLYERYCQSPLIHVPPPEVEVASARIFRSTNQVIPAHTPTYLIFDSVVWDDYNFFDPAQPDRLTIPVGALYEVGCCIRWYTAFESNSWVRIRDGVPDTFAMVSHYISDTGWAGAAFNLHFLQPFRPGDFLRVQVYNSHPVQKEIAAEHHYTPHFWIRLVGAYPV